MAAALANREPTAIHNHVTTPEVRGGDTHVHMAEGMVSNTVQATMPPVTVPVEFRAGDTRVDMQPQTVVLQQQRGATRQVITERDDDGEARVIETHPLN